MHLYKHVLHFQFKPIHHVNYEHWSLTVEIFMMTALRMYYKDDTGCNDHLQILKLSYVMESACSSQIVQPFPFIKKRLNSLVTQYTSFSTSVTL